MLIIIILIKNGKVIKGRKGNNRMILIRENMIKWMKKISMVSKNSINMNSII